ncbi:hypothetical protein [Brevibacillus sp. 179-C9.3 HS]|uniref:hypothetical protein n=1 Tax=unclassified Brevibacillus TaxID=2684853 RepID=UPI0039A2CA13
MKSLDELQRLKQFIASAEHVWTQIANSPRGKPVYTVNGVDYTPLPEKYNSKRKISRIFRRYWGKQLTEVMIRNLNLRMLKGKLCVPYREIPTFPTTVQSLQIKVNRPDHRTVAAILSGGGKKTRVDYRLIRVGETKTFTIMKRSGDQFDLRYQPIVTIPLNPKSKSMPRTQHRGKTKK